MHIFTNTYLHTYICIHTRAYTHIYTPTLSCAVSHLQCYKYIFTYIHMYTYTCLHTHTYTYFVLRVIWRGGGLGSRPKKM